MSTEAPPTPSRIAGTMMKTLDAGVTDESVIMMFSRIVSDRASCCS
ncbi:hypothetical protein [Pimelobacter simplex]